MTRPRLQSRVRLNYRLRVTVVPRYSRGFGSECRRRPRWDPCSRRPDQRRFRTSSRAPRRAPQPRRRRPRQAAPGCARRGRWPPPLGGRPSRGAPQPTSRAVACAGLPRRRDIAIRQNRDQVPPTKRAPLCSRRNGDAARKTRDRLVLTRIDWGGSLGPSACTARWPNAGRCGHHPRGMFAATSIFCHIRVTIDCKRGEA